jgi:hypothetical protein
MKKTLMFLALLAACKPSQPTDKPVLAIPNEPELILDVEQASRFAALSIACVDREYPNKPGNVVVDDRTVKPPRELTPAFYGCFDWHSAVHGHWTLVRLLKTFPDLPEAAVIRKKLDAHLTPTKMEAELGYLKEDRNDTFERPYGWGWFLRLAAELETFDDPDAKRWRAALDPVARYLARRSIDYFDRLSVPIREGTHPNTAFAMVHMLDYARAAGDRELARAIEKRARDFYEQDRGCPTGYEPSGEHFLSPCLAEADLMRRVLGRKEFASWLGGFLPPFSSAEFRPMLAPAEIKDLKDPKIGHLIGLSLHRAWCYRGIAGALHEKDPQRPVFEKLARLHRHVALRQMFDSGYGGEHWLASFAVTLLTGIGR